MRCCSHHNSTQARPANRASNRPEHRARGTRWSTREVSAGLDPCRDARTTRSSRRSRSSGASGLSGPRSDSLPERRSRLPRAAPGSIEGPSGRTAEPTASPVPRTPASAGGLKSHESSEGLANTLLRSRHASRPSLLFQGLPRSFFAFRGPPLAGAREREGEFFISIAGPPPTSPSPPPPSGRSARSRGDRCGP